MLKIKIEGARELADAFNRLNEKVQKKVLKQGLKESGQPVLEIAKASVPVLTGALYASLDLKVSIRKGNGVAKVTANTIEKIDAGGGKKKKYDHTFYAKFIELGSEHAPAQPFLRPALYGNKNKSYEIFRRALQDAIDSTKAKGA